MMSLVAVGVLILSALSIVCFAAYKIRAKSFEVSTSVGKIASLSIKIISADAVSRESVRDRVELLGRDARSSAGDEASLPSGPLMPPLVCGLKTVAERPMMASG
jgi:tetrahydromethanopterin S-methyltransferase subunit F